MERKGITINIPYLKTQAEIARNDQAAADRSFRDWARSLHPDGEYVNTTSPLQKRHLMFGHMTVVRKPSSSSLLLSSLELSDTTIYEPEIRALLGTAPQESIALGIQPRVGSPEPFRQNCPVVTCCQVVIDLLPSGHGLRRCGAEKVVFHS